MLNHLKRLHILFYLSHYLASLSLYELLHLLNLGRKLISHPPIIESLVHLTLGPHLTAVISAHIVSRKQIRPLIRLTFKLHDLKFV